MNGGPDRRRQHQHPPDRRNDVATRTLLGCGAIAGPLFVASFLREGAVRDDYDPMRHPVSSLALGPGGWKQRLTFSIAGGLYLAGALGLARFDRTNRIGPTLIGAAAVGLLGAGGFVTDPVSGYPPGTPDAPAPYSASGALHDVSSLPTFVGIPTAALVYARHFARDDEAVWAAYSATTGAAMLVTTVLASMAFGQEETLVAYGGLLQRAAVTTGFTWLTVLSLRALRNHHPPTHAASPAPHG